MRHFEPLSEFLQQQKKSTRRMSGQNIQVLRLLVIGFSQRFYCNGSELLLLEFANFIYQSFPRTDYQYIQYKLYFFMPISLLLTLEWGQQMSVFFVAITCLLVSHGGEWSWQQGTGEARCPPNLGCFPEGDAMHLKPSWSNGNMPVPSESECREMLLIKAALLQVCAC